MEQERTIFIVHELEQMVLIVHEQERMILPYAHFQDLTRNDC